jgi:hypothetical protein
MDSVYGLTPAEAFSLKVPIYVRYVMEYLGDWEWDSERICEVMEPRGWASGAYQKNLAGNVLSRLAQSGAGIRVRRGVYEMDPDVVKAIQRKVVLAHRRTIPPDLVSKLLFENVPEKTSDEHGA